MKKATKKRQRKVTMSQLSRLMVKVAHEHPDKLIEWVEAIKVEIKKGFTKIVG